MPLKQGSLQSNGRELPCSMSVRTQLDMLGMAFQAKNQAASGSIFTDGSLPCVSGELTFVTAGSGEMLF